MTDLAAHLPPVVAASSPGPAVALSAGNAATHARGAAPGASFAGFALRLALQKE